MPLQPCTVITGASTGIGREIALLAAAENHVVLIARDQAALEQLAREIVKMGLSASIIPVDLSIASSSQTIGRALNEAGLYCETLVVNAGLGHLGYASGLKLEEQMAVIDVNIRSLTELCILFLPAMLEKRHGRILALSSIASSSPGPGMAVYYASKAYVRMFAEALWQETRGTGVTVSCLCPGPVNTPFLEKSGIGNSSLFRMLPLKAAKSVAKEGWLGLKSGKRLIVPGVSAKLAFFLGKLLPRRLLLPWLLNAHVSEQGNKNRKNDIK